MWLEARDDNDALHLVALENKLGAKEGPDQLCRYDRGLAGREAESRTLVYMTMREHKDFEPPSGAVSFQNRHWFEVYTWLTESIGDRRDRSTLLVEELLSLMEAWGMNDDMGLGALDLAVGVAYKTRVQDRLLEILYKARHACETDDLRGSWGHPRESLTYWSPAVGGENVYYEFGFDFWREDEEWSVAKLQLPSAYFGIRGEDVENRDWSGLSEEWSSPPKHWGNWEAYAKVRQLLTLEAGGLSLDDGYLELFLSSLEQVRSAMVVSK